MDHNDNHTRHPDDLTPEQVNAVMERVNVIREALQQSEVVIDSAQSGKLNLGADATDVPHPNVVYIAPHIKVQYDLIATQHMGLEELLRWFEKWTVDMAGLVAGNIYHFKNPAVTRHAHEILDICRIIDYAAKTYFDR